MIATLGYTYTERLEALRRTKMEQTAAKTRLGARDRDDHGDVLPPDDFHFVPPVTNHPSGGFFGAAACGANFRAFLEAHPVYVDPMSSLAGAYMVYFTSHVPELEARARLLASAREQALYGLVPGIGGSQHFAADLAIGLSLGWGGLLEQVRHYREVNRANPDAEPGFYDGLEDVVLGIQNWIRRTASRARELAAAETQPEVRANLEQIAEMNERLVSEPPRTFREACQWIAWYQMVAQMYNGSGALGQLDELLRPYYERDVAAGILTDEEAIFHLACLLLNEHGLHPARRPGARRQRPDQPRLVPDPGGSPPAHTAPPTSASASGTDWTRTPSAWRCATSWRTRSDRPTSWATRG